MAEEHDGHERLLIDTVAPGAAERRRTITFGSVTMDYIEPDAETLAANLQMSRDAMRGLRDALLTPGVKLNHPPHIPLFSADPNDVKVLVRELNGRTERGRLVRGAFVPID